MLLEKLLQLLNPFIIWAKKTFGTTITIFLFIIYPIIFLIGTLLAYTVTTTGTCTLKTVHYTLTGQMTVTLLSLPTTITQFTPGYICDTSILTTLLVFIITGVIAAAILHTIRRVHQYIIDTQLKDLK